MVFCSHIFRFHLSPSLLLLACVIRLLFLFNLLHLSLYIFLLLTFCPSFSQDLFHIQTCYRQFIPEFLQRVVLSF